MKNKFLLLITCLIFFNFSYAQTSLIGTKIPDLIFKKVLNDKDTTHKIADFAGKAVIIDFWATWCGSCIEGFPMLDSLQKTFSKDLKIITVTSDNEARIIKFLTKFKTNLSIALDTTDEFGKIFPHRSIPHTLLIDKKGVIKAVTTSANINKETVQKLINGDALGIDEKKDNMDFDARKNSLSGTPNVLNQITLMPYLKGSSSMYTRFQNGRITFINSSASIIYEALYGFQPLIRSFWETDKKKYKWAEENLYCLEIIAPNKTEKEVKDILINYLQSNISLKARVEEKEKKVKVLRRIGKDVQLVIADANEAADFSSGRNGCDYKNVPFNKIADYIEGRLSVPVIDETGLTEKYNLKLIWENEDKNKIYSELKKLGLELVDDDRKIKILVFYE
jgi:uncharacterized protein (TIGR03435 family)